MVEFFQALSDRHTYNPWRNSYILFGIGWGLPVPLFSLSIHLYAQQMDWTIGNAWSVLSNYAVHLFFLLHPLFFGVVFGALGTLRRLRDERIAKFEQEKLLGEIKTAQDVQAHLFPSTLPCMKTLDYFGKCKSALGLSGDYYDFLRLGPNQLCLALGDISGKGISAALLMANLQALLRSRALFGGDALRSVMADVSRLMCSCSDGAKYASFFCGVYDDVRHTFTYVNAGHTAPMLFRIRKSMTDAVDGDGKGEVLSRCDLLEAVDAPGIVRLESSGMPLGIFPNVAYQQETVRMQPGELLLLFTDGVTEAMNTENQEFGELRLANLVATHRDLSPTALIDKILAQVATFARRIEQQDDRTLIVAKVI